MKRIFPVKSVVLVFTLGWMFFPVICLGSESVDDLLNGRTVILDTGGEILPWVSPNPAMAYTHIIELSVEFLKNDVLLEHGYPIYYCRPEYGRDYPHVGRDWYSNPVDVLSGLIHSYVQDYYAFTGDSILRDEVIAFADYMIAQGSTPTESGWAWHGCPYQQDFGGVLPPRASDRGGAIMPPQVGKLGRYYVWLYKATNNMAYLTAAIHCADSLADNDRTGTLLISPWPWRVNPESNAVYDGNEYGADVIDPIALFDELIALGYTGSGRYITSRNAAWTWLFSADGPMSTGNWTNYFEDIPYFTDNDCQINLGETARYLLEHPEMDPDWQTHVTGLISDMETVFGTVQYGAITMNEQMTYYLPMISHTARYASVCARYYEMTGDEIYREKAYRAFNWSTYGSTVEIDRVFTEIMDAQGGWFTDCHGDFIQHIFEGMASVPEWAPWFEIRLLRSSSVIQSVNYGAASLEYETFDDAGREVVRCPSKPGVITAGGITLPERIDLEAEGWTWDPVYPGGVCRIRHDNAGAVVITWPALPTLSGWGLVLIMLVMSGILRFLKK